MLDTSKITSLASDPTLAPVVADIIDGIQGLPAAAARDHLRAAQDAIWDGAWRLPAAAREPLIHAIGGALA